ncbi:hypothetical protein M069_2834 [Bacteroides fragilis str. B1 (UDC16-1)]|nr:hypothetical protein M069_2834 [Bacteroides fragilis str. B1 (UDC16-1)]
MRTVRAGSVTSNHCNHRFCSSGVQSENRGNLRHHRLSTHRTKLTFQRTGFDASIGKSAATRITTSTAVSLRQHFGYLGNSWVFVHGKFLRSNIQYCSQYKRNSSQRNHCNQNQIHNF